jgi:hypothetical protein
MGTETYKRRSSDNGGEDTVIIREREIALIYENSKQIKELEILSVKNITNIQMLITSIEDLTKTLKNDVPSSDKHSSLEKRVSRIEESFSAAWKYSSVIGISIIGFLVVYTLFNGGTPK